MSKTFAIGDLHGRYDLFWQAVSYIVTRNETGKIVFLGDYIDRGPESAAIVKALIMGPVKGWEWITLMGNHEDMMVNPELSRMWYANGGEQTINNYRIMFPLDHDNTIEWHKEWMKENLKLCYQDQHRFYVHAFADLNKNKNVMLWERYEKFEPANIGKFVVHGHTPNRDGPIILKDRINLDVGAYWQNKVCIAEFDDDIAGGPIDIHWVAVKPKPKLGG